MLKTHMLTPEEWREAVDELARAADNHSVDAEKDAQQDPASTAADGAARPSTILPETDPRPDPGSMAAPEDAPAVGRAVERLVHWIGAASGVRLLIAAPGSERAAQMMGVAKALRAAGHVASVLPGAGLSLWDLLLDLSLRTGAPPPAASGSADWAPTFRNALHSVGKRPITVIIDDAERLSDEMLQSMIGLLRQAEVEDAVLHLLLCGTSALSDRLGDPGLAELRRAIAPDLPTLPPIGGEAAAPLGTVRTRSRGVGRRMVLWASVPLLLLVMLPAQWIPALPWWGGEGGTLEPERVIVQVAMPPAPTVAATQPTNASDGRTGEGAAIEESARPPAPTEIAAAPDENAAPIAPVVQPPGASDIPVVAAASEAREAVSDDKDAEVMAAIAPAASGQAPPATGSESAPSPGGEAIVSPAASDDAAQAPAPEPPAVDAAPPPAVALLSAISTEAPAVAPREDASPPAPVSEASGDTAPAPAQTMPAATVPAASPAPAPAQIMPATTAPAASPPPAPAQIMPAATAPAASPPPAPAQIMPAATAPAASPPPAPAQIMPAATVPAASPPLAPAVIAGLLRRGDELLDAKDVAAARLCYERAASAGNARAATMAGWTYDPGYFRTAGIRGIAPDPAKAGEWYRRAVALGDATAASRLQALPPEFRQ